MQDRIHGVVTNILGRDRFELRILDTGRFNEHNYKNWACVRIAGINDPELYPGNHSGLPESVPMEKLKNREVQCFIMAKDSDGNAVAVVQCVN